MIMPVYKDLSIREQCKILDVTRSSIYYEPLPMVDETKLANEIYDIWMEWPQYGYRKITMALRRKEYTINHKKVLRIMQEMDIQAMYQKPKILLQNKAHKIYPLIWF